MMLSEPHTATFRTTPTDDYGTILSTVDTSFSCFIEKKSVTAYGSGQVIEIGKGVIYTTDDTLTFDTGDTVLVDSEEFRINLCYRGEGLDGAFSHWELTYG